MTKTVKGEAFIIKKRRLLGNDILITFFSQEYGKIGLIGRGAGTLLSRRAPHIQTGNLINFVARRKDSYWYLAETDLISAFSKTKESETKLNQKYIFLSILDRLLAEEQKEEKIYIMVKKFFVNLAQDPEFKNSDVEAYLNLLLQYLGYSTEKKSYSEIAEIVHDLTHTSLPAFLI